MDLSTAQCWCILGGRSLGVNRANSYGRQAVPPDPPSYHGSRLALLSMNHAARFVYSAIISVTDDGMAWWMLHGISQLSCVLAPAALTQPRILREHYSSLAQPQTGFFSFFFLLILNNRTRLAINLFHRLLLMTPWSCMMCSIINVCLQYQVLEYSIVRPSCMHHQCNQSKVPS